MLFRADQGKAPCVIFLTDIGGIRPENKGMARWLAEKADTVMMPNVFYRIECPTMFDFTPTIGEARTMKRFVELAAPMTPDRVERGDAAYVDSSLRANR